MKSFSKCAHPNTSHRLPTQAFFHPFATAKLSRPLDLGILSTPRPSHSRCPRQVTPVVLTGSQGNWEKDGNPKRRNERGLEGWRPDGFLFSKSFRVCGECWPYEKVTRLKLRKTSSSSRRRDSPVTTILRRIESRRLLRLRIIVQEV